MSIDPLRIHLSLVSHTNIGKTTLARTLLSRDIGEVADRAHVTETTDDYVLARSPEGAELILWDTPGFGNSVALAKRLAGRSNPVGWFLSEVWDRMANKTQWLNQRALKHVNALSQSVLYLVNATELPETAPYVRAEMHILEWIGKPVIVLLNQIGQPRPHAAELGEVERWAKAMKEYPIVSGVLSMDAFARCWVQEFMLFDEIAKALPTDLDAAFESVRQSWSRQRRSAYASSIEALKNYLNKLAGEREVAPTPKMIDQIKFLGKRLGLTKNENIHDPAEAAQTALSARATDDFCALTDRLIVVNGLKGKGIRKEILQRMQSDWQVTNPVDPRHAAVAGAIGTGAAGGLATDLASGGLTLGLGTLIGTVVGALGGAGLAIAYNHQKGASGTTVTWSEAALKNFFIEAVLLYLAIAHFGRGRGNWVESEYPPFWRPTIEEVLEPMKLEAKNLSARFDEVVRAVLLKLYPEAKF